MSARLLSCVAWIGLAANAMAGAAMANELVVPGYYDPGVAAHGQARTYRATPFPPPQHDAFGQPVPPPDPYARPSYRQTPFPPTHGQYGGGFVELLMTGDARGPGASGADASGAPVYGTPRPAAPVAFGTAAAGLPQSALPDYTPQPPAYYGRHPTYAAPEQQQAYAPQAAGYDPIANDPGLATRPMNPIYVRQEVAYAGRERPGTIIIDTPEKFLFLVQPGGRALRYGIGVGRPGFAWSGIKAISRKAEWPDWTPPPEMLQRRPDLPRHMDGGPANPLGARALYLGSSLYRIHGTNEPYTIGTNVSSGCIRMMNDDVVDLYGRVGVGTRVIVM